MVPMLHTSLLPVGGNPGFNAPEVTKGNAMKNFIYYASKNSFLRRSAKSIAIDIGDLNQLQPQMPEVFSCSMTESKNAPDEEFQLVFSVSEENKIYSLTEVVEVLQQRYNPASQFTYIRAPLELYYKEYQPMLQNLMKKSYYRYYGSMGITQEMMLSTLHESIAYLFCHPTKSYYLHKSLIQVTFNNNLKKLVKSIVKHNTLQLDRPIKEQEDGSVITFHDLIPDPDTVEDTIREYWEEQKEIVRDIIVSDIGRDRYNDLLRRLDAKATTNNDAQLIARYRREFCPKPRLQIIIKAKAKEVK